MLQFWKLFWERTDKTDWNKGYEGYEVNTHLTEMCKEKNIFFINHGEKIKKSSK